MSAKDHFEISGPFQLADVDWENPDHRRIVMGSLVNGVYVQTNDQRKGRQGSQALAPPWWESFHFTLKQALYHNENKSIYGAIYQLDTYAVASGSPNFVIAFRGTQIKKGTAIKDLKLDWNIFINKFHETKRVEQALDSVKKLIDLHYGAKIWLAGHSMGAAIALLVGRKLAKDKPKLETFLFNPPIISVPINQLIEDEQVKKIINTLRTVGRAFCNISKAAVRDSMGRADSFDAISEWMPHLYVNPRDPICSEYMDYFENRERWRKHELGMVESIASQVSLLSLQGREEPLHFLASAELNINEGRSDCHSLQQWYDVGLRCHAVAYRYTSGSC